MLNRRLRLALRFFTALLLLALAGSAMLLLVRMRSGAETAARQNLEQTSNAAVATINRYMLQLDSTLAQLPVLLRTAAQGRPLNEALANTLLRNLNFQNLSFRDILIAYPNGRVWAAAQPTSRNGEIGLNLHSNGGLTRGSALAVLGPVRNMATSEWSLYLARPVGLSGSEPFLGVIEVPVQMITGLLAPAGDAVRVRIRLERDNGQVLASVPHNEAEIGRTVPNSVERVLSENPFGLRLLGSRSGTLEIARRALYPDIQIHLAQDFHDVYSDYERDKWQLIISVGCAAALLLSLAIAMDLSMRQRERLEGERAKARRVLESAIEAMPDGFVMWDADDRLVTCNRRFRELYVETSEFLVPGVSFEDVVRAGAQRGQYPQCGPDIEAFVSEVSAWRRNAMTTLERLLPDGRWVLVSEQPIPDGGHVGIRTDVTALKRVAADLALTTARAEEARCEAQVQGARFHAALDNMSHGLCMVDRDGQVIICNRRFASMFCIAGAAGTPVHSLFTAMQASCTLSAGLAKQMYDKQLEFARNGSGGDFVIGNAHGTVAVAHRPMADGGWVATYEDITERARAESRIRFMAHHDTLTELPNRALFREQLEQATQQQASANTIAVLCLDLDRFKQVNDTLGHPAGDLLLIAAARRLRGCTRGGDFVARLGGDEFAIVHSSGQLPETAEALAHRVIEQLSEPYEIAGTRVVVGVSVGLALGGVAEGGLDADTLLKSADVALYRAKAAGRGTMRQYRAAMGTQAQVRANLEADLRTALAEKQFRLVYQPFQRLANGSVSGFEALVRWSHPDRGLVSPADFIPVAEDTGLMVPLGEWILRTACTTAVSWPANARLSVNLSPVQLRSDGVVRMVTEILRGSGLDASRLELELTETALLQEGSSVYDILQELRALGIGIALDDFGTGFSSLRHLTSLPVDRIKIDRSFVSAMEDRSDCRAVVGAVASLAHQLGVETTAEGVETIVQLDLVRAAGCTEAQGYFISKLLAIGEATRFLLHSLDTSNDREVARRYVDRP